MSVSFIYIYIYIYLYTHRIPPKMQLGFRTPESIIFPMWVKILARGNSMQAVILINEPELKITYEGQIAKEALSEGHLTCKGCESHRANNESS